MATIQSVSLAAPDVNNLATDGNSINPGLILTWSMPNSDILLGVEIWRSIANDRSLAEKIGVVIGTNRYIDNPYPNITYYYWIRGVNIYGKGTGKWYPESSTAGIPGTDLLPYFFNSLENYTGPVVSDNTWQTIADLRVSNPTGLAIKGTAIFTCSLESGIGATTQFRLTVINDPVLPGYTYPSSIGEVSKPSIAIPVSVPINTVIFPYIYKIEFLGPAGGTASVARRGMTFNWNYVMGAS